MKSSLWSDDEEEEIIDKSKEKPKEIYKGLFDTPEGGNEEKKTNLFAPSVPSSGIIKSRLDTLFGVDDDSDDDDPLFGSREAKRGSNTLSKPNATLNFPNKIDIFAEEDEDNDDIVERLYQKKCVEGTAQTMKKVYSGEGNLNLFADDDDNDDTSADDLFGARLKKNNNDVTYKSLYEKEVAKCTQLELKVEELLERIAALEEQVRGVVKTEDEEVRTQKEANRQSRQKNRHKIHASRHKKRTAQAAGNSTNVTSNNIRETEHSEIITENISKPEKDFFGENIVDCSSSDSHKGNVDRTQLAAFKEMFDHSDIDISDDEVESKIDVITPQSSILAEESMTAKKDNNFVSNRQKQILARQAKNRAKLLSEKYKNASPKLEQNICNENERNVEERGELFNSNAVRRGSSGGLKYEGGGWVSSSEDSDDKNSNDNDTQFSSSKCKNARNDSDIEESNATLRGKRSTTESRRNMMELYESEIDAFVRSWCAKQQNLITMIQSIPEIYCNDSIPSELYQVNYSSPPSQIRKAYLKIARICHPDKQKKLINAGA